MWSSLHYDGSLQSVRRTRCTSAWAPCRNTTSNQVPAMYPSPARAMRFHFSPARTSIDGSKREVRPLLYVPELGMRVAPASSEIVLHTRALHHTPFSMD
jgi:hypothetical protein